MGSNWLESRLPTWPRPNHRILEDEHAPTLGNGVRGPMHRFLNRCVNQTCVRIDREGAANGMLRRIFGERLPADPKDFPDVLSHLDPRRRDGFSPP
jgi:hypothetical protein